MQGSVFGNIRIFLIFRQKKLCFQKYKNSFLLREYENFLIFELERSISRNIRNFFRVGLGLKVHGFISGNIRIFLILKQESFLSSFVSYKKLFRVSVSEFLFSEIFLKLEFLLTTLNTSYADCQRFLLCKLLFF